VTRLTDGSADFSSPVHHEYSSTSPFNSDGTRILVFSPSAGYMVVGRQGEIVESAVELQIADTALPRWSTVEPDLIYYKVANVLWRYDIGSNQRDPIYTVTQFPGIRYISEIARDPNGRENIVIGHLTYFFRYTLPTDTLPGIAAERIHGGPFPPDPNSINYASIGDCEPTPKLGNVTCRFALDTAEPGFNIFDGATGTWLNNFVTLTGHSDFGIDADGEEILVLDQSGARNSCSSGVPCVLYCDPKDAPCPQGCFPGIEKVRLSDGQRTCLVNWADVAPGGAPWGSKSSHVSVNNTEGHPWVLVSVSEFPDPATLPSARSFVLPANWEELWGVYFNEVFLVKLDGSNLHRLAHHRARDDVIGGRYWSTPRASLSRDGKFVLFDSNFAQQPAGMTNYTDVYLIPTTLNPLCGPCVADYCDSGNLCHFTSACGIGGCCIYTCTADPECTPTGIPPGACGQF
jgi:hypothetical protein